MWAAKEGEAGAKASQVVVEVEVRAAARAHRRTHEDTVGAGRVMIYNALPQSIQ